MKDELHRHLDGELSAKAMGSEELGEARDWDRMVASFRTAAPTGEAPPWLEQKVMAEIEGLAEPNVFARFLDWFIHPAQVRISPLAGALMIAAFAIVIALPGRLADPTLGETPGTAAAEQIVYVQFLLEAPAATSVALVGDFNEWQPTFALEDVDGDGVWTARVPVQPGVHGYMFLIDGTEWKTDPRAERYRDDGFGNQNAILAIASGA